jgi:hypothetical protein
MLAERAIYFFVVLVLTLVGLVWGLIDTRRVIETPFLYSTGMALIVCPQMYIAASDATRIPYQAFWTFTVMVILCTVALWLGYFRQPSPTERSHFKTRLVIPQRLYRFGLLTAFVGAFGIYKLTALGTITVWRGWPVYWLNIAVLTIPGITMMLVAYVNSPSIARLVPIIAFWLSQLPTIFDSGRRAATLTLPLVLALPFLIYKKNLRVPRWAVLVCLFLAYFVVYAFPVWRGSFKEHHYLQTMQDNPPSEIFNNLFDGNSSNSLEITDGMIVTGARYQLGNYEFGASLYNQLVQNYFPGSLLGQDLKSSLFISHGISQNWVKEVYGIPVAYYTAKSGYEDLFSQFSFFGCIVMYAIGRGFRKAHDAAVLRHDGRAVLFLCFFISFPAGLAYGSVLGAISLAVPQLCLMLIAYRWCTRPAMARNQFQRYAPILASIRPIPVLTRQNR